QGFGVLCPLALFATAGRTPCRPPCRVQPTAPLTSREVNGTARCMLRIQPASTGTEPLAAVLRLKRFSTLVAGRVRHGITSQSGGVQTPGHANGAGVTFGSKGLRATTLKLGSELLS